METHKVDKGNSDGSLVNTGYDETGVKHINEYLVVRNLGQGAYGKVKLCLHSKTNKQVAVKVL